MAIDPPLAPTSLSNCDEFTGSPKGVYSILFIVPFTSSFEVGVVVPIPTLPPIKANGILPIPPLPAFINAYSPVLLMPIDKKISFVTL
ncbi:hypothetical protein D3C84_767130 [compost metagenome]